MKKTLAFLFALIFLMLFASCQKNEELILPDADIEQTIEEHEPEIISSYYIERQGETDAEAEICNSLSLYIPSNADGSPMFSDSLNAALDDPKLDDSVFDVWIYINFELYKVNEELKQTFLYEGKTMDEWHELYLTTLRAREEYKMQLHSKLENVPYFDKWSGSSKEAVEIESEWDYQWKIQWEDEHPGELYPMTAYEDAKETAAVVWRQEEEAFIEDELQRIADLGITLDQVPNESLYSALISKEQLLHFPIGENIFSYTAMFANEEDCSFSGAYINEIMD